ncbi:polyprenyltransferase, mitochondrial [Seminavis robusta]|uniref:Polyprenyltransferase, mitochondrial n=1 Tax=Seminavis robusta TaxID=568900 RepID=A0A9N8HM02_9STRA|nr:polyprenyltransferase, mitochondrial [Seminavis robusta]|eukprot:Sro867_g213100.1 polyprenyltransferase, mitochondrial (242) ;mRNA; f:12-737
MRGAGCTINDLWDRDVDQKVARTKTRPLAGGDVTVSQAIGFLAAQLSVGLGVLVSLPHTWYCFQWGTASLPLVAMYPLTKRFLPWPQMFLGVTINWGAWMGWAATHGSMDWSIVPFLYGSGVTWTLVYDTIYAHQDKADDTKLGLHSTALAFGDNDQQQKMVLHGLAALTWLQWMAVGYNASDFLAVPYYQLGVTTAYAHLVWQIHTADFDNPHNLAARFRSNSAVGALIFGSIAAGGYFQ